MITFTSESNEKMNNFETFTTFTKFLGDFTESPVIVHNPRVNWGLYTFTGDSSQSPIQHITRDIYICEDRHIMR